MIILHVLFVIDSLIVEYHGGVSRIGRDRTIPRYQVLILYIRSQYAVNSVTFLRS